MLCTPCTYSSSTWFRPSLVPGWGTAVLLPSVKPCTLAARVIARPKVCTACTPHDSRVQGPAAGGVQRQERVCSALQPAGRGQLRTGAVGSYQGLGFGPEFPQCLPWTCCNHHSLGLGLC